ncbi:MAG: YfcE family phosphodiesterase [Bacteroidetes bacterium]|nr:YfcE family phosphodiesterase [Bacteroidota bacterium]
MKILLLSDTHSYLDDAILKHAAWADEIWHAGDWGQFKVYETLSALKPVRGVFGNIDGQDIRSVCRVHNRFICEGLDVWITHIGGYPGRYNPDIRQAIQARPPGLFICGHSHILKIIRDPKLNLLHMNPGAAGIHGFHKMRTMIRFEIEKGKILNPAVIELGPRIAGEE